MRWLSIPGLAFLFVACGAPELQSQKLKDGSWSFTCELSMDECIRRVQEQCPNQRFRIIEGTSETRLRDAPPFERAYHTSRLHLRCNDDGADVLLSVDSSKAGEASAPAPACSIGQTRECVGASACKGGQTCLADRSGYGACDCGPVAAPPASETPPAVPPPASSTDPVPPAVPAN